MLTKSVIVLDDDSDRVNRFQLTLSPPENKVHRSAAGLLKLEHTTWSVAQPKTGVPRSVMSVGQCLAIISLSRFDMFDLWFSYAKSFS